MPNVLRSLEFHDPLFFQIQSLTAIIFYFSIYSFFGWVLENTYSLATTRTFFKANFLKGPFKPMYGFAPVALVYLITNQTHWSVMILLCLLIPTFVEYMSGVMLQKIFRRQYWDYSNLPLQLHGHVCLPFSLCWIFLSLACIKFIHPVITSWFRTVENFWSWTWPLVLLYFLVELFLAIRRHSTQVLTN